MYLVLFSVTFNPSIGVRKYLLPCRTRKEINKYLNVSVINIMYFR